MSKVPMTPEGFQRLKDELKKIKTIDRPAITDAIEEAKGHGDLSENAEYHAAKEKQGHIEAKMREIEDQLSRVEVIDPSKLQGDKVVFGAKVTLCDEDTGENITYQIVGDPEADIRNKKLSISSPLARGLIGRRVQDICEVKTPKGKKEYSIIRIDFK